MTEGSSEILVNYEESVAQYENAVLNLEKSPVYTALFEIGSIKESLKKRAEKMEKAGFKNERTKALNIRCDDAWKKYNSVLDQEHLAGTYLLFSRANPVPYILYDKGEFVKVLSDLPDDMKKTSIAEYNSVIKNIMLDSLERIKTIASEALETKRLRDFIAVTRSMELINVVGISGKKEDHVSAENVYIYNNIKGILERLDIRNFSFDDSNIAKTIEEALLSLKDYNPIKD